MRMPLRTRWRMFVLTRTAVNGSSQRATSSGPASTASAGDDALGDRGHDGLRLVVVSREEDVLVQRMLESASAFALSVVKPATILASGAARAASSASDSSPGSAKACPSRTPTAPRR